MNTEQKPEQPRELPAEEAAHCLCPIAEAYAGMDEMGSYLDKVSAKVFDRQFVGQAGEVA